MKNDTFTIKLIAARPQHYRIETNFTDSVMSRIQSTEILSNEIRRMSVNKKETLVMKLIHLPKLAIVAIAIGALLLLGGTAYALYQALWQQPSVTTQAPTTNQFGRTQVIASFEGCGDQTAQATFEIKHGSTLETSEISKILQARCELDAIREWSGFNSSIDTEGILAMRNLKEGVSTSQNIVVSPVASKVVAINDTELSLTGDQYNTPQEPLVLNKDTIYIVGNQLSTRDQIKPGDSVTYVQQVNTKLITKKTATGYSTSGTAIDQATTSVIKMSLPFEYYGPSKQNLIAERKPCEGNPLDSCVQTASVDLYESPDTYVLKPDGKQGAAPEGSDGYLNEYRSIQGIITEHTGKVLKIKSSSGRVFTLTTPTDIVAEFNLNRSANYNNTKVSVGDMLQVSYMVDKTDKSLSLDKTKIISIDLALSLIQKSDPIQKY